MLHSSEQELHQNNKRLFINELYKYFITESKYRRLFQLYGDILNVAENKMKREELKSFLFLVISHVYTCVTILCRMKQDIELRTIAA